MWKNNGDRKNYIGGVRPKAYCTYQIDGLNLDNLINYIAKQDIKLYNIKKAQNKRLIVSVNYADGKKIFAIAKSLCYNIKKIKNTGRDYPFIRLYKRIGLILGAVAFMLSVVTFNDLILSVDFIGDGSIYKKEAQAVLSQKNIRTFTRFSHIDLARLEDQILAESQSFSFVSCQKKGTRLVVELVLRDEKGNTLTGKEDKMLAKTHGVVERIKVYRGKAMVNAGDRIEKGQLLVSGYATIKEQEVFVGVIAYASILTDYTFDYVSDKDGLEDVVLELFKNEKYEDNVVAERIEKEKLNDKFVYKCTLIVRREYTIG